MILLGLAIFGAFVWVISYGFGFTAGINYQYHQSLREEKERLEKEEE